MSNIANLVEKGHKDIKWRNKMSLVLIGLFLVFTVLQLVADTDPVLFFGTIVMLGGSLIVYWYTRNELRNYIRTQVELDQLINKTSKNYISTSKVEEGPVQYIPALQRRERICCYQSARLNDKYCYCGRVVPEELQQEILNTT